MNPALRLNQIFAAVFAGAKRELTVSYLNDKLVIDDNTSKASVSMKADAGVTFEKDGTVGDIVLKPGVWTFSTHEGCVIDVTAAPAKAASPEVEKKDTPRKTGSSTPAKGPFRKAD